MEIEFSVSHEDEQELFMKLCTKLENLALDHSVFKNALFRVVAQIYYEERDLQYVPNQLLAIMDTEFQPDSEFGDDEDLDDVEDWEEDADDDLFDENENWDKE